MLKTLINLPEKVIFCKSCVMSNQRPQSHVEFLHNKEKKDATYMTIENDGICSPFYLSLVSYCGDGVDSTLLNIQNNIIHYQNSHPFVTI